jgi:hypothetical protein
MNEKLLRGLAFGVAAAAVAVVLAPSIARRAAPVMRMGMKTALVGFMRGREAVAEFVEMVEDAYAEATAELKQEADAMAAAEAAPAAPKGDEKRTEARVERKRKRRS